MQFCSNGYDRVDGRACLARALWVVNCHANSAATGLTVNLVRKPLFSALLNGYKDVVRRWIGDSPGPQGLLVESTHSQWLVKSTLLSGTKVLCRSSSLRSARPPGFVSWGGCRSISRDIGQALGVSRSSSRMSALLCSAMMGDCSCCVSKLELPHA